MASRVPFLIWTAFMVSAAFWIPAYRGELDDDRSALAIAFAIVGVLATALVRDRSDTRRAALLAAIPAFGLLALAVVAGIAIGAGGDSYSGEAIYRYLAVALWASWAVLLGASAGLARVRWSTPSAIAIDLIVASLGLFLYLTSVD